MLRRVGERRDKRGRKEGTEEGVYEKESMGQG
jgi:hypothetical protein